MRECIVDSRQMGVLRRTCTDRKVSATNIHLPSSGNLSITNHLKQSDFDYQGHLAIENKLKVEKILNTSKTSTLSPRKNALGTRFFTVHKVPSAKMTNFTKNRCDNRRKTMDHISLGKSFEIANLSKKNNSNVHLC